MLKNWTVKAQNIDKDGLAGFLAYLEDETHPNHEKTERIAKVWPNSQFLTKVYAEGEKREAGRTGGRKIKNYAKSLCFSLPPDVKPSDAQWEAIAKDIFRDVAKFVGVSPQKLKPYTFLNIHHQETAHLNFVVSTIIDGKNVRKLMEKRFLEVVKHSFNAAVLDHAKVDFKEYEPKRPNRPNFNNIKTAEYVKQEINKANERAEREIEQVKENARKLLDELEVREKLEKVVKRVEIYLNRMIEAPNRVKRQENEKRARKTYEKIQDAEVKKVVGQVMTDYGLSM